jgi:uncharacterized protein YyaL (SSP411 family)
MNPQRAVGKPNRLASEKSPYLQQHADNPVDWYPWSHEAFERALREDKPIFLSSGYSTCHWCHVMAHESFEDAEVARLMNETFVSIKVDREERPDIDDIYMTVCQLLTGSGGWPLTIVMTPDKKPFFAATYIPKESRFGRLGMLELIPRIQELWRTQQEKIHQSADEIVATLTKISSSSLSEEPLTEDALRLAYQQLSQRFDEQHGGFGTAPKFPTPHQLTFLLRYWKRTGEADALEMVEKTLQAMQLGGIYDHVGFGFHRYATDSHWLVPHFEKMLYDQALLAIAYTEAYQTTGKREYERRAREIFTYVLREMTAPEGGFYSAEDADSEGEEGKFYLWTEEEIRQVLTGEEAELVIERFQIERHGNFHEEATRTRTGRNILHLSEPLAELDVHLWERAREKLFHAREQRVHPHKDDKILTDWNGLMIAALAKAAQAFDEPRYAKAARQAAEFILTHLRDSRGRLLHRYRDGQSRISGFLDDYACFSWALLELYEATFEVRYLQIALEVNELLREYFWDEKQGGFFFTAADGEALLVRRKEIYDGAVPSGNSVALLNLLRLARMTGRPELEERAARLSRAFASAGLRSPVAHTQFLCGLAFALGPAYEVVIVGDPTAADAHEMLRVLRRAFVPNEVVLFRSSVEAMPQITHLAEFTRDLASVDGKATAYVCRNYHCSLPTTSAATMLELLQGASR